MSTDPDGDDLQENPQSWNTYMYVRDNPIVQFDPDGRATTYSLNYKYYPVMGKTAGEAEQNATGGAQGHAGGTTYDIRITNIDSVEAGLASGASSTPISVDVHVSTVVALPKWGNASQAPKAEQQKFTEATAKLKTHEQGHVKIANQGGQKLEKTVLKLVGTGKGPTAEYAKAVAKNDLVAKANAATAEQRRETDKKEKDYDAKTDNGRNQ